MLAFSFLDLRFSLHIQIPHFICRKMVHGFHISLRLFSCELIIIMNAGVSNTCTKFIKILKPFAE